MDKVSGQSDMLPCRGYGPCGCSSDAGARSHSAQRCDTPYPTCPGSTILRNTPISSFSCQL